MGERVQPVVLDAVGAEREVEDPDVQSVAPAVLHHPVDPGDDLGDVGGSRGVGDLDAHHPGIRGDPDELVVRDRADRTRHRVVPPSDDPRHVGAVTVGVQVTHALVAGLERQVGPVHHLARRREPVHRHDP
jgi:hypothetical protein